MEKDMVKVSVTYNISRELADAITKYAEIKGQTKTVYVTRALMEQIRKDEEECQEAK